MSNLAYVDADPENKGKTPDEYSDITKNDWMSEEEREEAFGAAKKTQLKLDPLQICLFPTYLSLPEATLQKDLRENLQVLVTSKLREDYGKDFLYFAFTDAKIDWYSGEEESSVCGSLENRLPSGDDVFSNPRDASLLDKSSPCTCALYSGATVMLKTDGKSVSDVYTDPTQATPEILEPKISVVLARDLVTSLRNLPSPDGGINRPIYTELKGTAVSWSVAQRQQGGKLVLNPNPEGEGEQLVTGVPPEDAPGTPILDEAVGDSTRIDVVINAVEEGTPQSRSANGLDEKGGKILASVVGALLFITLVILFTRLHRKKKRKKSNSAKNNDMLTVISEDAVDEEIAKGSLRRKSSVEEADTDDISEAAQYPRGNVMDSISVGSEWTYTTGVTGRSSGNKTAAEMMAAKETFDRDRQITLQKDMLQSEWSGAMASPSGLNLTRTGNRSKSKIMKNDPNTLQFEEATGQGEEIFLMEPAR